MISAGTYVKVILKKRGMSQEDLVRQMKKKGLDGVYKTHISTALNVKMFPYMARKIEIGLDLPKYTLVKMVGMPKGEAGMRELEKLDKYE